MAATADVRGQIPECEVGHGCAGCTGHQPAGVAACRPEVAAAASFSACPDVRDTSRQCFCCRLGVSHLSKQPEEGLHTIARPKQIQGQQQSAGSLRSTWLELCACPGCWFAGTVAHNLLVPQVDLCMRTLRLLPCRHPSTLPSAWHTPAARTSGTATPEQRPSTSL